MLELEGLVAMPWSMNERSGVAFRANRVKVDRRGRRLVAERPGVGEGRGVGRADVAAVVSRARGRRAGSGAAARAVRRSSSRRCSSGWLWALWSVRVELGAGARARWRFSALVGGRRSATSSAARSSRVVLARCSRFGRRGGSCCGCCTRCAFGGRGRGRRSTRASPPGRSGVRACGRSRACPRVTCFDVRVRRGQSVADLDARREHLAACLRAREVRVLRDPRDAAQASVLVVRRDPFEGAAPVRWPAATLDALSLWEPIPVGVDEQGEHGRRSSWSSATC